MMRGQGVDGALPGFAGSQGRNWREQRSFFVGQLRKNSAAGTAAQAAAAAAAFNSGKSEADDHAVPVVTSRSRRSSAQSGGNQGFAGCNSELEVDTVVEEEADGMVRRLQEVLDKSGLHNIFYNRTLRARLH